MDGLVGLHEFLKANNREELAHLYHNSTHLQLCFQLFTLSTIEWLGGDDFADDLSSVRRHDQLECIDDGIKLVHASVLGQLLQEESGGWGELDLVGCFSQSCRLQATLDGRVDQQVAQLLVLLDGSLESDQVLLDGFEGLLFGGGREKCARIAALNAENLNWRLHQLLSDRRRADAASLK